MAEEDSVGLGGDLQTDVDAGGGGAEDGHVLAGVGVGDAVVVAVSAQSLNMHSLIITY